MPRVLTCLISMVVVLRQEATAQLSLSTPTDVQCYDRPVTLVCTHPVLPQEPEYRSGDVDWSRDGRGLRTSDSGFQISTGNSTTTKLQFTINENTTGNYTCFLVNLVQSRTDESNSVSVRPREPRPPSIHTIISLNTSIAFNWTHTPINCYKDRISYYVSWVNTDITTENGSDTTSAAEYNITGLVTNGNYTISVQAVVDGNVRVQSRAVSEKVTVGQPQVLPENSTQPVCYNRMFNLICEVPSQYVGNYSNISWILDSRNIRGFTMYRTSNDGTHLVILNVTRNTTGDYECHIELNDGSLVEGETYDMEPLDSPEKPHNIVLTPGVNSISVSWQHDNSCFENYVFKFIVTWRKAHTRKSSENMIVIMNGTTVNIPVMEPNANYIVCVSAVSISNEQVKSEQRCQTTSSTPPTGGVSSIAIGVPIAVVVIVLTGTVVVILIVCAVWRCRRSRKEHIKSEETESLPTDSDNMSEHGVPIRNQPQNASQRTTTNYADLDFTGDGPVPPPPSLENVTYTEVGTKPSKDVDTSTELPPKQDQQQIKAFRDDVKAVLDKNRMLCKDLEDTEEIKGIKRESAFTAEYNGIHFVAICVHTLSDLNINHVHMVIETRHLTWAKVGLLISNQPTIPAECLLTLEDDGCQFVPVVGYGEEGWEDRMIDKFKNVYPKVANDDSELTGPVQESSPPPGDNGKLPTTYPKEKVVGMLPAEHDKEPSLDHPTQLRGSGQDPNPPDDGGKLPTTRPKEKVVEMLPAEHDKEPFLDHPTQSLHSE